GIKSSLDFKHWGNIYCGKLIFEDIEKTYNVRSKYSKKGGIIIKFETNRPSWKIIKESGVITGYGQFFPCVCTDKGTLFADKIDALLKKNRARHIYDIIFMLSRQYPVREDLLKIYHINAKPMEAIEGRIMEFKDAQLKKIAEELRPFLFDESEADLIANAKQIIPALIKKYNV
ncbi:MAG: nucleotidyl transferase AbiEii/AbiGii toxin family protein, partial [Candidatus Omnitrophica bacterium]|nr:nucleotidyl transferase AbiEii/AbiGii toxin family protein [Candidatus Omnitrophota bacterium]